MTNPVTNFKNALGTDLGDILITKDYLISAYPQLGEAIITPELWVWGDNAYAQIGDNTTVTRSTPVTTFAGSTNWKQVASGQRHTAAIKTDGTLWLWGSNNFGQLGINNGTNRSTPVTTFAGGTDWKQVTTGATCTAAIKTDGTLWLWGVNSSGQLGINVTTNRSTPVTTFAGGTNWKQVSGGGSHIAAIKTDGTLWTWGSNTNGQLGDNTAVNRSTPVTTFAGGTDWKQASAGSAHTTAIKTDGTLWVWGLNTNGQLGDNTAVSKSIPVTTFAGGTNWKQVAPAAVGGTHTAAIKTDGTLWVWGSNGSGQLGINAAGIKSTPVTTFAGGTNWKQISASTSYTSAIKTDGTLWTWGLNSAVQLGDNTTVNRSTPVTTFAGGTNWKQVSGGGSHMAATRSSDDLTGL